MKKGDIVEYWNAMHKELSLGLVLKMREVTQRGLVYAEVYWFDDKEIIPINTKSLKATALKPILFRDKEKEVQ